jgi:dihydrofolate reductase
MELTAIVAATPEGVIGRDGQIPWRQGSDLARFKKLTMGHALIMGRKTYDSIGRPLPGRRTIVITRQEGWTAEGVDVVSQPLEAIRKLGGQRGFVVGGRDIYAALWEHCATIMLTRVWARVDGDVHLPPMDWSLYEPTFQLRLPSGPKDDYPSEFCIWRRTARRA